MATTINSYSVSLGLDASNFIDGSNLSRQEVSRLRKDIEQARNPMEQLAVEQDRLRKALDSGAISLEVYNRLLEDKRRKLMGAAGAAEHHATTLEKISQVANTVTGVVQGVRAAFDVASGAVNVASSALEKYVNIGKRIDDVADSANNLGLSYNQLGSMRYAAKELGGDQAAGAIDNALSKAMKQGFVQPGEDAAQAFARIADEISGMVDPSERVQRATEVFGKTGADLVGVLSQGGDATRRLVQLWERTNALTEAQVQSVGEFGDNMDRIELAFIGISNIAVAELAPAMNVIGQEVLGWTEGITDFKDGIRSVTDFAVVQAGYLGDLKDIAVGYASTWNPKNWFSLSGSDQMAKGFEFNGGTEAALKIMKERQRFEEQAAEAQHKREMNNIAAAENERVKKLKEAHDLQSKLEQEAADAKWEDAKREIEREKRARDQMEREQKSVRDKNLSVLQNAMKQIEEENKRGPATAVFGTSEYTKAYAAAVNRNVTATKPTDQQILERAKEQLKTQQEQDKKLGQLLEKTGELVTVSKENGFRRIN